MKKVIFLLAIALGLIQTTQAQVACDIMNLIVNVSDTALVKLYHPGPYLTWPPAENIIVWEITDTQGNIIAEDTLIDDSGFLFNHDIPLTDTMNVSALLTNDSAGVACLIEDELFWEVTEISPDVFIGRWEFVNGNVGVDVTNTMGVEELSPAAMMDNKTYDLLGRAITNPVKGVMYIRNNKKYISVE
jgi:hypothetical protein